VRAGVLPRASRRMPRDIERRSVRVRRNRGSSRFASPSVRAVRDAVQRGPRAIVCREKSGAVDGRTPHETRSVSSRGQPKLLCRYLKGSAACPQSCAQSAQLRERYVCNVRLVVARAHQQVMCPWERGVRLATFPQGSIRSSSFAKRLKASSHSSLKLILALQSRLCAFGKLRRRVTLQGGGGRFTKRRAVHHGKTPKLEELIFSGDLRDGGHRRIGTSKRRTRLV